MDGQDVASDLTDRLARLSKSGDEQREDSTLTLTGLVTSAAYDDTPEHTLRDVYQAVINANAKDLLDPLQILPALLTSHDPAADDLVSLIGECGSAREVIIAAQEATEFLHAALENEQEDGQPKMLSLADCLDRLINLYACALPRLKLRKKSTAETITPPLKELCRALASASSHVDASQAPGICMSVSRLVSTTARWAKDNSTDLEHLNDCHTSLFAVVSATLTSLHASLHSSLAERVFKEKYPQLRMTDGQEGSWESASNAIASLQSASDVVGRSIIILAESPSIVSLILMAHSSASISNNSFLAFLPVIMPCLYANAAVDYTLAFLLSALTAPALPVIEPESAFNLSYTLALLSAVHQTPSLRLIAFRLVSMSLPLSSPVQQLELLREMLGSPDSPPQLRVAAVGLARDVCLRCLADDLPNLLASSYSLQVLGPIVLRPNPPDLLTDPGSISLEEFCESPEAKRLTECLGFYYVLYMRDTSNQTGIRDKETARNVEQNLLAPLRAALTLWMDPSTQPVDGHPNFALVGLYVNLKRIDDALSSG